MKRINRIGETDVIRGSRAVVLAAALMGVAAASQAQVRALGPGVGVSCGVWLEARTDAEGPLVFGLLSWVLGYISGAAVYGSVGDVLRDTDLDGVATWLDNYCRAHPAEYLVEGARRFVNDRRAGKKPGQPTPPGRAP